MCKILELFQKYPNFPRNFAPDFPQYRSEDPNQRKPNKKEKNKIKQ